MTRLLIESLPIRADLAPRDPLAHRPCGYKTHVDFHRTRLDGTLNCEKCHPTGEALRLLLEDDKRNPPPTYHYPRPRVEESAESKRKRRKYHENEAGLEEW